MTGDELAALHRQHPDATGVALKVLRLASVWTPIVGGAARGVEYDGTRERPAGAVLVRAKGAVEEALADIALMAEGWALLGGQRRCAPPWESITGGSHRHGYASAHEVLGRPGFHWTQRAPGPRDRFVATEEGGQALADLCLHAAGVVLLGERHDEYCPHCDLELDPERLEASIRHVTDCASYAAVARGLAARLVTEATLRGEYVESGVRARPLEDGSWEITGPTGETRTAADARQAIEVGGALLRAARAGGTP